MEHAILRLQRWVRRRHLRHQWLEIINDLREWKELIRKLDESKKQRAQAATVLQRRILRSRESAAVSAATSAPAQDATPVVLTGASSVITAADLQAVMDEAERLAQDLGMADGNEATMSWLWSGATRVALGHVEAAAPGRDEASEIMDMVVSELEALELQEEAEEEQARMQQLAYERDQQARQERAAREEAVAAKEEAAAASRRAKAAEREAAAASAEAAAGAAAAAAGARSGSGSSSSVSSPTSKAAGKQRAQSRQPPPPPPPEDEDDSPKARQRRQQEQYRERLEAQLEGKRLPKRSLSPPTAAASSSDEPARGRRAIGAAAGAAAGVNAASTSSGSVSGAASSAAGPSAAGAQESAAASSQQQAAVAAERAAARRAARVATSDSRWSHEDAILTANLLHKTVMDRGLPIAQEGYAQAAAILHRKHKTSAPRVLQGMQQLSTAFLVLQAGARGYFTRVEIRAGRDHTLRALHGAADVVFDFLHTNANRERMNATVAELVRRVQASTKIAAIARGMSGRSKIDGMLAMRALTRGTSATSIQAHARGGFNRRAIKRGKAEQAAEILKTMLNERARLRRNVAAVREMRAKMRPLQLEVRRKRRRQTAAGRALSATIIQTYARGMLARSHVKVVRARRHASDVQAREAAMVVIAGVLTTLFNRRTMSASVLAVRHAAREVLARRRQLELTAAQMVAARYARGRAARRRVDRLRVLDLASAASAAMTQARDIDVFAPCVQAEYYDAHYAPPRSPSPPRSPGAGGALGSPAGATGAADVSGVGEFEYMDGVLTEEQLTMLDGLAALRIGFVRHDHSVRGAQGISFFCYRGRATPAQFPFQPTAGTGGFGPALRDGGPGSPLTAGAATMAMEARMRLEMRGLAVHRATRRVLCRPYHKFWYAGQRPEQAERELMELSSVPSLPLVEKLEGVMVQAFVVDGRVYLATRSGRTNAAVEAEALLRGEEGQRWVRLAAAAFEGGYTPLFEFKSPKLDTAHHKASLTLTALRHRTHGAYMPYNRLAHLAANFGVSIVPHLGTWAPPPLPPAAADPAERTASLGPDALPVLLASIRTLLERAASMRPIDGCVLILPSGLALKVKAPSHFALPLGDDSPMIRAVTKADATVTDASLGEAVHVLLACAADAAASPTVAQLRVGHWAQRPSRERLTEAAAHVLKAAELEQQQKPYLANPAYSPPEQVLADALELCLQVARAHGTGLAAHELGGYPIPELHSLLAEELGLLPRDGPRNTGWAARAPRPPPVGSPPPGVEETRLAAAAAGGVRQTQSWPAELLGCAWPRNPTRSAGPAIGGAHEERQQPYGAAHVMAGRGVVERSRQRSPHRHHQRRSSPAPRAPRAAESGAFGTPLLASMFANLSSNEEVVVRRRRLAR